ncbi:MAG TPA: PIN domain nuclease [Phycisphaerales bacterium]|nr:PIN domain nuclease [Phycisphaerales bacterium]HCD33555.1 PIN domain nuclease [Phycisphaerales bacterium]|tara:strand:+ start:1628 stop:2026 length:399 start_codon:yes stop_codon:yes gene_type:complete
MNVIADTCIWSAALRRKSTDQDITEKLVDLITHNRIVMLGPIRQELLSGITDKKQFEQIRNHLAAFDDFPITTIHYETAATFYNKCRLKGIQGSHIDFLICAVSAVENLLLYTLDKDFNHYKKHLDVHLMAN